MIKPILLFIDDIRNPEDCLNYLDKQPDFDIDLYKQKWNIVRTYSEFVRFIETHGLPNIISFDHDLADYNSDKTKEYTGMDCAKWLVEYCLEKKQPMPDFIVHSANPIGAKNISTLLNNFRKIIG